MYSLPDVPAVRQIVARLVPVRMRVSPRASESAGAPAHGSAPAASTAIDWDPTRPSTVAVIVAVPAATPVTTPVGETVAIWEADDAHVADLPVMAPPEASKAANVSVTCWPTVIVVIVAAMLTVATAFGAAGSGDPPPPQASASTTTNGAIRGMSAGSGLLESSRVGAATVNDSGRWRRLRPVCYFLCSNDPHGKMIHDPATPVEPARSGDDAHMRAALELAAIAAAAGEVPVGALIVCDGRVIARASNSMRSGGATAHAELAAIQAACAALKSERLERCTLYVTLEPCAMCAGAIVLARIRRVVFGAWDEKAGMAGSVEDLLRHRRLNHAPEVQGGVLADESAALLRAFFDARR